jgi:aspartate racemase
VLRHMRRLVHTLIQRDRLDAIVVAETELALVFDIANTDFPVIDCAAVHIDGMMRHVCGQSSPEDCG